MKLQRSAERVLNCLKTLPDGSVVTTKRLMVMFPVRFRDIRLAVIGKSSFVYGLFAFIVGDDYALCNMNGYIKLEEASISIEDIDGIPYYVYVYEEGSKVISTLDIVARSNLIFIAIDEFIFKGKVPWYVDYEDMGKLFDTAASYAGSRAKITPAMMEFFAAYVARDVNDRSKFIRETAVSLNDFKKDKIAWVPLRSVYYSAPGTVNKLSGAYFQDGVVSALVNPSSRVESVETILRA